MTAAPDDAVDLSPRRVLQLCARLVLGLGAFLAVMLLVANRWRPQLEGLGRWFVESFGLAGMAFGTFVADGFHFPVPPQFYMLMGITSGISSAVTLSVIGAASIAGGTAGFLLARRLGSLGPFERRIRPYSAAMDALIARYGELTVVLLASLLLPVAFSVLCYLAGLKRLGPRAFAVICLFRLPKLVAYYYLVELGWQLG